MSTHKAANSAAEIVKPIRIQRSRQHKQESPNGLPIICVSRPSRWGNPFKLQKGMIFVKMEAEREAMESWLYLCDGDIEQVMNLYRIVVNNPAGSNQEATLPTILHMPLNGIGIKKVVYWCNHYLLNMDIGELAGKNLSCWCKLEDKCHADILLRQANQ